MTLFSRISNFLCPKCNELQPAFALLTAVRSGALNIVMNESCQCSNCRSKNRLRWRKSVSGILIGIFVPLLLGLSMIFSLALLLVLIVGSGGDIGAVLGALSFLVFGSFLLVLVRARLFRKVFLVEDL
ncbi:hypothetical protein [Ruegeria sp. HU-ET01832]|uniref:hypothetical protein n=1 Tax=Ruegeria sp. HU-ET01832 TaxID=3135906 RepID=UPI00147E7DB1